MTRDLSVAVGTVLLLFYFGFAAYASPEFRKAANLMTTSEAALATMAIVSQRFDTRIEELSWSVEFAEREWVAQLRGNVNNKESQITITGYVWGGDNETLSINYSGLGNVGGEPLLINGTAKWLYNNEAQDYQGMDFQQVTKIGQNSFWGWVVGAEIIVGGTAGGVVAVGVAATLVTISTGAKDLLASDTAPPPPAMPARPNPPKEGDTLSPREGEILVALSTESTISGTAVDGVHVLTGSYSIEKGSAQGSINAIKQ
jgi:hypothetical protein